MVHRVLAVLFVSALAAGCAAKRVVADPPVQSQTPAVVQPEAATKGTRIVADEAVMPSFDGATLYFAFDDSGLSAENTAALQQVADVMRVNEALRITIAGHSDERGTTEYNLALGNKRAEVAKRYLTTLGADATRISTTTYGEEAPAVDGRTEEAHAANRRDVIAPQ